MMTGHGSGLYKPESRTREVATGVNGGFGARTTLFVSHRLREDTGSARSRVARYANARSLEHITPA